MKQTIITFCCCMFFTCEVFAQQQAQYSQYMMNYYTINPAAAGIDDYIDIRSSYRQQWSGMQGAPKNYYLTAHTPLNKIHGRHDKKFSNKKDKPHHFVGGMITGQKHGAFSQYSLYGSYGYYLPLTKKWNMSMSVSAGLIQYSLNPAMLNFGDDVTDPAVPYMNKIKPDMGLGIWISSKRFFTGISTMQLFDAKLSASGSLNRHFYITAGYSFSLNKDWNLVPSVMLKTVPFTASQIDLNVKFKYQQVLWAGISYRNKDAVIFMAGFNVKNKIEFGYSYDYNTSGLSNHSKGSHECMLALKISRKARVISPSDFW